jgi:hypothetical protein
VDPAVGAYCCAGGSADRALCPPPPAVTRLDQTPPPAMCIWWEHRTRTQGVRPAVPFRSLSRADDVPSGFLEGVMNLPVDGRWLVRFGFFSPAFSARADPNAIFPTQSIGQPSAGATIDMNINGVTQTFRASSSNFGQKLPVEFTVEGQQLRYRFDFRSSSPIRRLHPFITPGEVVLVRDRNPAPPPPPDGSRGKAMATARDAVDGNVLAMGAMVSNGYIAASWKVADEVDISFFTGSTLVSKQTFKNGNLEADVPPGSYSCIAVADNFYAYFLRQCDVLPRVPTYLGDLSLSPMLNPGTTRAVLTWGFPPKDLDTYLTVPGASASQPPCLIWYKNKVCNKDAMTQVSLDLDSTGHTPQGGKPETTSFGSIVGGRYIYRVQVYQGTTSDVLLNSAAVVTFYSEDFQQRFVVGRDGYVEGINWFVFYLDGATQQVLPCDRTTCPTSLCAAGGWRVQQGTSYLC